MSKTVDERVVSMQFDNRNFEKNVSTSMSTLEKLKQSLNFKGATKGLDGISSAVQNQQVDFRNLEATACSSAFSLRDVWIKVANVFEYQIAGRIISAGKRMVSSLTIDPIKTGLQEYETQLNSVQTILANTESKGSTLEDVNKALDELNLYADKTIYNFTEMTRNIGTFTAAGVELETSVSAIKGIANLAAVSGSTSQQASTAMYQLSQALSTGTVRLMDWNSVVNAGMGGQVFQDALKETARVHGVAVDDIIKKQGSFRESLSEGWLTSEILLETLNKFTGDLSAEQLKSMGYTEKQVEEIIKLGETANNAATKVKTFTQLLDTLKESAQSGWAQTWELIIGDFEEARSMWTKVSDVIGGVISKSAEGRNALLSGALNSGWDQLLGAGIMDESGYGDYIKHVAKEHGIAIDKMIEEEGSLEKVLSTGKISSDILSDALSRLTGKYEGLSAEELKNSGYTQEQVDALVELNKQVQNGSISMDEFADKMKKLSGRELLMESFANIWKSLVSIVTPIKEAFREIFPPTTADQLYKIIEAFRDFTSKLILSEKAQAKLKSAFKGLFAVIDIVITAIKEVAKGAAKLFDNITDLAGGILGVSGSFGDWISGIRDTIKESGVFGTVIGGTVKILQSLIDKIKTVMSVLKEKFVTPGFNGFLGVLTGIWKVIQFVADKIMQVFGALGKGLMNAFRTGDFKAAVDVFNSGVIGTILLSIKGFMSNLSDGFSSLGGIASIMDDIKGVLGSLKDTLTAYQKDLQAKTLMKIAGAIGILAVAILIIASIEPDRLTASLGAVTILFADLMTSMALFTKIGGVQGIIKSSVAMIAVATAVLILASALKKVSDIDPENMKSGLLGIAALTAIVTAVAKVMSKEENAIIKGATGLIAFALAIKILASACADISKLSWSELIKGLVGVGALMAAVSVFLNNTKFGSKSISTGIGMIALAAAIKILASACSDFSSMNWKEIGRGLTAIAAALTLITIAVNFMPKNMVAIGLGLLGVSAALLVLSSALSSMGGMSWEEIGKSLVVLGGALALLAIGLNVMTGTLAGSAALMIASVAIGMLVPPLLLLGMMSWESIIKGLVSLAGAFVIIGVAGYVLGPLVPVIIGLAAAVALIGVGVLAAGAGLLMLSAGITAFATALATSGTIIIAGITAIIAAIIGMIPSIIAAIGEGIILICKTISGSAGAICDAAVAIIVAMCDAIIKCIPKLVNTGIKLILALLDGISQNIGAVVEKAVSVVTNFIDGIRGQIPVLIDCAFEFILDFINGISAAIETYTPQIIDAAVNLGASIVKGVVKGLSSVPGAIWDAICDVGSSIKDGFKDFFGINSPAKEMNFIGQGIDEGIIVGLEKYKGSVVSATEDVGDTAIKSMSNAMSKISDAIDSDVDIQPTIKPVIDLSNVEAGAGAISDMFGTSHSVGVLSRVDSINSSMNTNQNGSSDDVLSALKDLKNTFENTSMNNYSFGNITYSGGDEINEAIQALIRAVKVGRRV